jgi:heat shock protein HtpX
VERFVKDEGSAARPPAANDSPQGHERRARELHEWSEVPPVRSPVEPPVVRGGPRSLLFIALSVAATLACGLAFGLVMDGALMLSAAMHGEAQVPSVTLRLVLIVPAVGCVVAYAVCLVIAWRRGVEIVLKRAGARDVDALETQILRDITEELALAAGVRPPEIAVIKSKAPNALVAGSRGLATICVTSGLLTTLKRAELEAVVAHELARVANDDVDLSTFLAANAATIDKLTHVLGLTAALMHALVTFAGRAAQRERVYAADDAAVRLTRDPLALSAALGKLAAGESSHRRSRLIAIAPLCFVDPSTTGSENPTRRSALPSIDDRRTRLRAIMHAGAPAGGESA